MCGPMAGLVVHGWPADADASGGNAGRRCYLPVSCLMLQALLVADQRTRVCRPDLPLSRTTQPAKLAVSTSCAPQEELLVEKRSKPPGYAAYCVGPDTSGRPGEALLHLT